MSDSKPVVNGHAATSPANAQVVEDESASTSAIPDESSKKNKKKKKSSKLNVFSKKLKPDSPPDALSPEVLNAIRSSVEKDAGSDVASQVTPELAAQIMRSLKLEDYAKGKVGIGGRHKKDMADHKFWATQPVPKLGSDLRAVEDGAIEDDKPTETILKEPYRLPMDFTWVTVDLNDTAQRVEVQELLTNHYVEDEDASFRFDYGADFIRWALQPPNYEPEWHIGVRVISTQKLVAFISGIPVHLRVRKQTRRCAEINFLCVHKKLRSKRLAPVLIKEVTRRCHLTGIFQAVYTAGIFLPTPISRCQYFHRIINTKKLVEVGFTRVPPGLTLGRYMARNKLPESSALFGFREIEERDLPEIGQRTMFDMLFGRDGAQVNQSMGGGDRRSYGHLWCKCASPAEHPLRRVRDVSAQDHTSRRITDFASFYTLPSTALKVKPNQVVDAAYLMYYATDAIPSRTDSQWSSELPTEREMLGSRLKALVGDVLIAARDAGFDVFNALTLADNVLFLEEHKFGPGDGFLHYYLYNWQVKPIAGGCGAEGTSSGTAQGDQGREGTEKVMGSGIGLVML